MCHQLTTPVLLVLALFSRAVLKFRVFRRLQAREDAAKRKDESMLLSTKKIIDSTDDVLRSAQALLKSTENKDGVEESAGKQPSRYPGKPINLPSLKTL